MITIVNENIQHEICITSFPCYISDITQKRISNLSLRRVFENDIITSKYLCTKADQIKTKTLGLLKNESGVSL